MTVETETRPVRRTEGVAKFRPRRIGPRSAGIRMTAEEFDALPEERFDDRYKYEIIRGVLIVSPPVGDAEADPNDELGHLLRTYQATSPGEQALDKTMPERYVPGTPNRRRCDRAIWAGLGRLPDTQHDAPAIVVEFVSSSRRDALRDYEEKRDEYLDLCQRSRAEFINYQKRVSAKAEAERQYAAAPLAIAKIQPGLFSRPFSVRLG